MSESDAQAFLHYEDPRNREPAPGAPSRRVNSPLAQHVAVRFPTETIGLVDERARPDGMTASGWIRRAVHLAIQERRDEGSIGQTE
ncbi:MAG: hypothetical protein WKF65_03305 [Gaiellaceae bacterium]